MIVIARTQYLINCYKPFDENSQDRFHMVVNLQIKTKEFGIHKKIPYDYTLKGHLKSSLIQSAEHLKRDHEILKRLEQLINLSISPAEKTILEKYKSLYKKCLNTSEIINVYEILNELSNLSKINSNHYNFISDNGLYLLLPIIINLSNYWKCETQYESTVLQFQLTICYILTDLIKHYLDDSPPNIIDLCESLLVEETLITLLNLCESSRKLSEASLVLLFYLTSVRLSQTTYLIILSPKINLIPRLVSLTKQNCKENFSNESLFHHSDNTLFITTLKILQNLMVDHTFHNTFINSHDGHKLIKKSIVISLYPNCGNKLMHTTLVFWQKLTPVITNNAILLQKFMSCKQEDAIPDNNLKTNPIIDGKSETDSCDIFQFCDIELHDLFDQLYRQLQSGNLCAVLMSSLVLYICSHTFFTLKSILLEAPNNLDFDAKKFLQISPQKMENWCKILHECFYTSGVAWLLTKLVKSRHTALVHYATMSLNHLYLYHKTLIQTDEVKNSTCAPKSEMCDLSSPIAKCEKYPNNGSNTNPITNGKMSNATTIYGSVMETPMIFSRQSTISSLSTNNEDADDFAGGSCESLICEGYGQKFNKVNYDVSSEISETELHNLSPVRESLIPSSCPSPPPKKILSNPKIPGKETIFESDNNSFVSKQACFESSLVEGRLLASNKTNEYDEMCEKTTFDMATTDMNSLKYFATENTPGVFSTQYSSLSHLQDPHESAQLNEGSLTQRDSNLNLSLPISYSENLGEVNAFDAQNVEKTESTNVNFVCYQDNIQSFATEGTPFNVSLDKINVEQERQKDSSTYYQPSLGDAVTRFATEDTPYHGSRCNSPTNFQNDPKSARNSTTLPKSDLNFGEKLENINDTNQEYVKIYQIEGTPAVFSKHSSLLSVNTDKTDCNIVSFNTNEYNKASSTYYNDNCNNNDNDNNTNKFKHDELEDEFFIAPQHLIRSFISVNDNKIPINEKQNHDQSILMVPLPMLNDDSCKVFNIENTPLIFSKQTSFEALSPLINFNDDGQRIADETHENINSFQNYETNQSNLPITRSGSQESLTSDPSPLDKDILDQCIQSAMPTNVDPQSNMHILTTVLSNDTTTETNHVEFPQNHNLARDKPQNELAGSMFGSLVSDKFIGIETETLDLISDSDHMSHSSLLQIKSPLRPSMQTMNTNVGEIITTTLGATNTRPLNSLKNAGTDFIVSSMPSSSCASFTTSKDSLFMMSSKKFIGNERLSLVSNELINTSNFSSMNNSPIRTFDTYRMPKPTFNSFNVHNQTLDEIKQDKGDTLFKNSVESGNEMVFPTTLVKQRTFTKMESTLNPKNYFVPNSCHERSSSSNNGLKKLFFSVNPKAKTSIVPNLQLITQQPSKIQSINNSNFQRFKQGRCTISSVPTKIRSKRSPIKPNNHEMAKVNSYIPRVEKK